jgi:hypothetical protein
MTKSFFPRTALLFLFFMIAFSECVVAAISVTPKFIFLDPSRRSVAVMVTNSGTEEDEMWVEAKFGYVVSDDTGGVHIIYDSTDADQNSAASWVRAYPARFVLAPDETQIVRLVVSPPAGMKEGEYWARINISSKPRKPAISMKGTNYTTGMVLVTQAGLAFHYRLGKLNTGVVVNDFKIMTVDSLVHVTMKLTRTGNASFWGARIIRLVNESGKVVFTMTKELVVYKSMLVHDKLSRRNIPPGNYKVEIDLVTGSRRDVELSSLIQAPPLRLSNPLIIQ